MSEYQIIIKARVKTVDSDDDLDLNDEDLDHLMDEVANAIDGADITLPMSDADTEDDTTDWTLDIYDVQESKD